MSASKKIIHTILSTLLVSVLHGYYDPTVFDKEKAYSLLDQIESSVGPEAFEEVRYDYALSLAERMGVIDRFDVSPQIFVQNVLLTQKVEKRFYKQHPLQEDDVKKYLLPLRIRYEPTSHMVWRAQLNQRFEPEVNSAKHAEEAAHKITDLISRSIKLLGDTRSYRLSSRGDLDPATVLRGGYGTETDVAIFGVAALRSVGVAARLAWCPVLSGENGGKAWLEYLSDDGRWICWVPSFGLLKDHQKKLQEEYSSKIPVVLTNPESPYEITSNYGKTLDFQVGDSLEGWDVSIMISAKDGFWPIYGLEESAFDGRRRVSLGVRSFIVALKRGDTEGIIVPVSTSKESAQLKLELINGKPVIQ